ncbi:Peroxin/Dysferlin domain-containing protein, partial [Phakopsora pachyrhizi]
STPFDILSNIISSSIVSPTRTSAPLNLESASPSSKSNLEKEPLSIQTTTLNFKNFVIKSGPIFTLQDAVEAILIWKNPIKTVFWGSVWAFLCIYPLLFLLLPNFLILSILLLTYSIRFPDGKGEVLEAKTDEGYNRSNEPIEGSVDYLSNMQNIQILMGRVSEGSDFLKENLVPYLDWSKPQISIFILHLTFVSSIAIALVAPLVPWRYLFLIGGEAILLANHPRLQKSIGRLRALSKEMAIDRKVLSIVQRIIANDALSDQVIDSTSILQVYCLEHERYGEGGWSQSHLSSGDPAPWARQLDHHEHIPVPGLDSLTPPAGFQWVPGEGWEICYIPEVGTLTNVESAGWVSVSPEVLGPSVRRRRWVRRAFEK